MELSRNFEMSKGSLKGNGNGNVKGKLKWDLDVYVKSAL